MVPPSHKGHKDPSTKEKYSTLLITGDIKKQGSEIEMTRGAIVDQVGREGLSDSRIFGGKTRRMRRSPGKSKEKSNSG